MKCKKCNKVVKVKNTKEDTWEFSCACAKEYSPIILVGHKSNEHAISTYERMIDSIRTPIFNTEYSKDNPDDIVLSVVIKKDLSIEVTDHTPMIKDSSKRLKIKLNHLIKTIKRFA
jgi:hypothetical protein